MTKHVQGEPLDFSSLFPEKPIIGMIHMPPLPGAPGNKLSMKELIDYALSEAEKLERAGLDACIVENVGDIPLMKQNLPPHSVASMALLTEAVVKHTKMKVGVNMLRNACEEALSIAHVAGAHFIRCNILIGAYATDQGIIEGCAPVVARLRKELGSQVLVFGDVHVKHAYPIFNVEIEYAAQDLAERGGADAIIVSGPRSPVAPTYERVKKVRDAVAKPVLIGSGISLKNAKQFYLRSDGLIVGEPDFKEEGVWGGPSDEAAYAKVVQSLRG
jgi:membrane complex biogenesis BtpA family protein